LCRDFKEEAVRLAQTSEKPITQVTRDLGRQIICDPHIAQQDQTGKPHVDTAEQVVLLLVEVGWEMLGSPSQQRHNFMMGEPFSWLVAEKSPEEAEEGNAIARILTRKSTA